MKCLPGGVSVSATDLSIKECIDLEINVILIYSFTYYTVAGSRFADVGRWYLCPPLISKVFWLL